MDGCHVTSCGLVGIHSSSYVCAWAHELKSYAISCMNSKEVIKRVCKQSINPHRSCNRAEKALQTRKKSFISIYIAFKTIEDYLLTGYFRQLSSKCTRVL